VKRLCEAIRLEGNKGRGAQVGYRMGERIMWGAEERNDGISVPSEKKESATRGPVRKEGRENTIGNCQLKDGGVRKPPNLFVGSHA